MENKQQAEIFYKENYQNEKEKEIRGMNLSISRLLWIDYQKFCLDLSRRSKKKISVSARIRILMIKDMLENKNSFS